MSVINGDPWTVTRWHQDDALVVHMFPSWGRPHTLDASCWCCPVKTDFINDNGARILDFEHHREGGTA